MKKILSIAVAALFFVLVPSAKAQTAQVNGTQHGVVVSWGAASPGTNPIAGYNVFRCSGTATTCPNTSPVGWTQENATPTTGLTYTDPSSNNFTNGASYTYAVQTVDTKGNVSVFSSTSTVQVPSAGFPSNATAPAAPTTTVQ